MTVNANEFKPIVGLSELYIAQVTADSTTGYTVGTPIYLAPVAEASVKPAVDKATFYADDMAYDTASTEAETTIELTVSNIPAETLALITGKVFDTVSGRVFDIGGTPPYFALGFKSQKSSGGYRYFWFLKGAFTVPDEDYASKSDKIDFKTLKITFTAIRTIYPFDVGSTNENTKRVMGDTDTTNFSATGWFTQVQTPTVVSPSAIALSSIVPADGATGIAVAADIVLTFNNALKSGMENNILLMTGTTVKACAKIIDTAAKVVTLNPTTNMAGSTTYAVVISGVTDIYNQVLADTVKTFTTA